MKTLFGNHKSCSLKLLKCYSWREKRLMYLITIYLYQFHRWTFFMFMNFASHHFDIPPSIITPLASPTCFRVGHCVSDFLKNCWYNVLNVISTRHIILFFQKESDIHCYATICGATDFYLTFWNYSCQNRTLPKRNPRFLHIKFLKYFTFLVHGKTCYEGSIICSSL